jgi:hypothetical protein
VWQFVTSNPASRFDWILSGGSEWIGSLNKEGFTVKQNETGFAALRVQKNDANIGGDQGTSVEFYESGGMTGYLRCFRDGFGRMRLHNTQAGASILEISAAGGGVNFLVQEVTRATVDINGMNVKHGGQLALLKSDETAYTVLRYLDGGGTNQLSIASRGAAWHWAASDLASGDVNLTTSAPPLTGRPGTVVLVYE